MRKHKCQRGASLAGGNVLMTLWLNGRVHSFVVREQTGCLFYNLVGMMVESQDKKAGQWSWDRCLAYVCLVHGVAVRMH
ncbi:hypothetical protein KFU94_00170 [Chloroflexi bacterium TSY]|nr:hypothetical protein [Chloroflexi bacterium TSY]